MSDNKSLFEMYNEKFKFEEFDVGEWCHYIYERCNINIACGVELPYVISLKQDVPDDKQSRVEMGCDVNYGIKLKFKSDWMLCVTEFVAPLPKPQITERLRVG